MQEKKYDIEIIMWWIKYRGYFQKGYTYQIFICKNPVSKTYLSKSMSPLDGRVMKRFDAEEEKTPSMRNV